MIYKGIINTIDANDNCRIVIWGGGMYGKLTFDYLKQFKYLEVVGWVDKNYSNFCVDKFPIPIQNPDIIRNLEYDYIIITAITQKVIDEICAMIHKISGKNAQIILIDENEFGKKEKNYMFENQYFADVTKEWEDYIYLRNKYESYVQLRDPKSGKDSGYLFLLWLQGWDKVPFIVEYCKKSVEKYVPDRKIIYLDANNYMKYIDIPNDIKEMYRQGIIGYAHFSDIIRLELLKKYGGLWLDATILLTGKIDSYITNSSLFVFQFPKYYARSISNWLMYAHSNQIIIEETLHLLYMYWRTEKKSVNYFSMHFCFRIVSNVYSKEWANVPFFANSNCMILQSELDNKNEEKRVNEILNMSNIHKLNHRKSIVYPNTVLEYLLKKDHRDHSCV